MVTKSRGLDIGAGMVPRRPATPAGTRQGNGLWLDRQTAEHYYDHAGGDPDAARELAARDGWRF
jgi:hypothetical protein